MQETLRFLMTREIAHFQQFTAALGTIQPNFPPGILQGDPRFTHVYYDMSRDGKNARGPWNEGQGPWGPGQLWEYVADPRNLVHGTDGQVEKPISPGAPDSPDELFAKENALGEERSAEVLEAAATDGAPMQWSSYGEGEDAGEAREEREGGAGRGASKKRGASAKPARARPADRDRSRKR